MAGETILVIDDGKDNRDFVVEYVLQPNGFKHLIARDGREGVQMALKYKPDLILLDLQMPRMNGIQVIEQLSEYNVDIPIILMTFHGSEEIAVEVYRMGVRDYVKKPYYPEEMLDAIERSLTEKRLRRERDDLTNRVLHSNTQLKRRLQELKALYNVGKHVTSITDMQELLPRIIEAATQITHAEECFLCLYEDPKIICRARKDQTMRQARAVNDEIDDPIARHVIKSRQPIILNADQLRRSPMKNPPVSVAYVPMILNQRVIGLMGVSNFTQGARQFSASDGALLGALGDYAAIAIENSRNYAAVQRAKDQMQDTFERFVPPSVVQQALEHKGNIQLGGTRREVSILFADIRGYTAWSETVEPEQVIEMLNNYLSVAAGVILGWEGTLDKYFGDGLMAIFNAPNQQKDHVHRAADAALAIMRAANEINVQFGQNLAYSIGVNVGEAVVGYIGTQYAINYTALGDTVNLAKRLQEYAAPGQILIDEAIVKRLGNQIQSRPLGELKVKGRKAPAFAYELLDIKR